MHLAWIGCQYAVNSENSYMLTGGMLHTPQCMHQRMQLQHAQMMWRT